MAMTLEELNAHIDSVMAGYKGDIVDLAHAIGAVRIGHHYGWRVLRIVISTVSYRKYQKLLNVDFGAALPEITINTERSAGYLLVKKMGNFWDVVCGKAKIDRKEKINVI